MKVWCRPQVEEVVTNFLYLPFLLSVVEKTRLGHLYSRHQSELWTVTSYYVWGMKIAFIIARKEIE